MPGCGSTRFRLAPLTHEIVATRDIRYRPTENPKHLLDVYAPEGASGLPVVHFVHGGYWVGGDKDFYAFVAGLYRSVGEALADRGIVTVVQSYRLVPEVGIDTVIDDVMAGLRWTESNVAAYGGDPTRIFMMGHSAGGHLTALAGADDAVHTARGMDPGAVRGYIVLSGIWDVADMRRTQPPDFHERVTFPVFGRDGARDAAYSPIDKLAAPPHRFLLMVGENDYPYLVPQAEKARAKLEALGAHPGFHRSAGADHDAMVLRFGSAKDDLSPVVADFVRQ